MGCIWTKNITIIINGIPLESMYEKNTGRRNAEDMILFPENRLVIKKREEEGGGNIFQSHFECHLP